LFTQALINLLVVAEAAISVKYRQVKGGPTFKRLRLVKKLEYLLANKAISAEEHEQWQLIRQLRNLAVHSDSQMILMPGEVLHLFRKVVDQINDLFK